MDETKDLTKDPERAQYVLKKFLELFNSQCDVFEYFIAKNGVLEWFGRTIKGNRKIHDFLRYEVYPQHDHLFFETATTCESFECKSSHMETQKLVTDEEVVLNVNSIDSSFAGDETVQQLHTPTTCLPETYFKMNQLGSITPPHAIPAKRLKLEEEHDLNRSLPPLLNIDDYFERKDYTVKPVKHCFVTPNTTTMEVTRSSSSQYSGLQYLETVGILRSSTKPKHRSISVNSSSSNVNGSWDRETRIKISYRIRLHDNDIQFALILYQNVHQYSSFSKRNLMSEFEEVGTDKRIATIRGSITKPITTTPEVKRKIGRRLRLL